MIKLIDQADRLLKLMSRYEIVGFTNNGTTERIWMVRDNSSPNGAFTNLVPFPTHDQAQKCWALNIVTTIQREDNQPGYSPTVTVETETGNLCHE